MFRGGPLSQKTLPQASAEPTRVGLLMAQMSAPAVPFAVHDPATSYNIYTGGLAGASKVCDRSRAPSTIADQNSAGKDFSAWLATQPHQRNLLTCTDDDVLVYIHTCWIPGRRVTNPSPNYVSTHVGLLSGLFQRLGRDGAYEAATGRGNPCQSYAVSSYRSGYSRSAIEGGFEEEAAVPLTPAKFATLMGFLWGALRAAYDPIRRLVLLRDILCLQYMWHSSMRGHDTGKLRLSDFKDPQRGGPFRGFPLPPPGPDGPYDSNITLRIDEVIKSSRGRRSTPCIIRVDPAP